MSQEIALFGPEMLANPYPTYQRLQSEDPVHWDEPLRAWVITRYDDIDYILRDTLFSSKLEAIQGSATQRDTVDSLLHLDASQQSIYAFVNNSMVFSDPPQHTRLRSLVSQAFTPHTIQGSRPLIEKLVDNFLDAGAANGYMDFVHDLAYPLPLAVIGSVLGIPFGVSDRDRVKRWCDEFLIPFGRDSASLTAEERRFANESAFALSAFVHEQVEEVRAKPRNDLLSRLVTTAESGESLTNDELFATFVLFLIAGHENLTSLLSNSLIALLENPAQLKLLQKGTVTWENGIHELMRYITPNQFIRRTALANIELRGRVIQKGEALVLVLAAANRDPEQFTDPNSLDVTRPRRWILTLGHGIHYCLGAPLAQLESEITLSRLFTRFPEIRRASDILEYENNFNVRLPKSLPMVLA